MKETDKKKFSLLMRRLKVTFPMNLSDKDEALRVEVYWEEFKNTNIEKFEPAINEAIKSLSFFPKPAELHGFILEEDEKKFQQKQVISGDHQLSWINPTKEGREMATKMIQELQDRWEKEDREKKKERDKEFEESRKRLKKQVKLIWAGKE